MLSKILIFSISLWLSSIAIANNIPLGTNQAEQKIKQVEKYFNNIKNLQANFIQTNPNKTKSYGKLYFGSNGRMRFEYNPPTPYLLISTGKKFIYIDKELQEITQASLSDVPLGFLLSGNVTMRGPDHRIDKIEIINNRMTMKMELFIGDVSAVELFFDIENFGLIGWQMTTSEGKVLVDFENIKNNATLKDNLFKFNDNF